MAIDINNKSIQTLWIEILPIQFEAKNRKINKRGRSVLASMHALMNVPKQWRRYGAPKTFTGVVVT